MKLGRTPRPELASDDVAGRLLACHHKIREHTALAMRLSGASDVPSEEIAAAAAAVRRYFGEALPHHDEDEDLAISPRLREHRAPAEVLDACARIAAEHLELRARVAYLDPLWARLAAEPAAVPAIARELADGAAALEDLFSPHLEVEERVIIPQLAAVLPSEVRREIVAEMIARRA